MIQTPKYILTWVESPTYTPANLKIAVAIMVLATALIAVTGANAREDSEGLGCVDHLADRAKAGQRQDRSAFYQVNNEFPGNRSYDFSAGRN